MTTYVDSSIVLRVVLKSPQALEQWQGLKSPIASVLLQIECLRTLDRLLLIGEIREHERARTYSSLHDAIDRVKLLTISDAVIAAAGQTFGLPLKTLDAIHLATAIEWREKDGASPLFATHDVVLANTARSHGFDVVGG